MLLQAGAPSSRVAVILNWHARGVGPDGVEQPHALVRPRDLLISRDLQHSQEIARTGARFARHLGAATRYALTVGLLSTPRFVSAQLPEIEVVNVGAPALRIEWRSGRIIDEKPIPSGRILYRGRPSLASASTIPNFGLGMKVFPYAQAR